MKKTTTRDLAIELANLNKEGELDGLIKNCMQNQYHCFKSQLAGPKVQLIADLHRESDLLKVPELMDIRTRVLDGEFDESADDNDKRDMAQWLAEDNAPESLYKLLGLEPENSGPKKIAVTDGSEPKWGYGDKDKALKEKSFDEVVVGDEIYDLFFGENPHSRQDNTQYARSKDGDIIGFDGFRIPFKIDIEESNYAKHGGLSGSEVRKKCIGTLSINGLQIFDCYARNYGYAFKQIERFIDKMEENWSWYPFHLDEWLDKEIGYKEQMFQIESFVVSQACVMLKPITGARKPFMWEDFEDYDEFDAKDSLKVEITDPNLTWYPKKK